jgi:hypothetical protein
MTTTKLLTGDQYLESLRDGREVYFDGEKVSDVTEHPAFRNSARSIARLYDALHDPAQKDLLLGVDRHGIITHKFFMPRYTLPHWGRLPTSTAPSRRAPKRGTGAMLSRRYSSTTS